MVYREQESPYTQHGSAKDQQSAFIHLGAEMVFDVEIISGKQNAENGQSGVTYAPTDILLLHRART